MKLLSVHKFFSDRDGASHYQLEVNRLLKLRGWEVIPFAMVSEENNPTPWASSFVSEVGTREVHMGARALKTFLRMLYSREAYRKITALAHNMRPNVAHIHNVYTQLSPSVLLALKRAGIPSVLTVHDYHLIAPNYMLWHEGQNQNVGEWSVLRATWSRFHKHSYVASFAQAFTFAWHRRLGLYRRSVSLFVCPSEYVARELRRAGYDADRICVLPHGIDLSRVKPEVSEDGSVLFVGRYEEEKGVRFVLDLAEAMPHVRFCLAGRGSLSAEVKERASRLSNVTDFGWLNREALGKAYARASVVLVPSLWKEVFGLVALEGMAYGKPVLVSDQGGLPEVVEEGISGRVLPAGDIKIWCASIWELLENPELRLLYGASARKRVEEQYDLERHVDALENLFQTVMSKRGKRT